MVSSSKSSTLNPALNGLYLLMRHMDLYQIFTRSGSWPDLGLVQIWLRSDLIERYSQLSAGLSVPSKHHSALSYSALFNVFNLISPDISNLRIYFLWLDRQN